MNDKQAIEAIDKYISKRFYQYAVMINGTWGCGKTFFVQHVLIPHINESKYNGEQKDINYISLYGLKSAEEITEQLCSQAIKDYIHKKNKRINTEGKMAGITSIIFGMAIKWGMAKVDASPDGMDKIIELLPNYDNNVIIFDDLERCCCDVNEILGFINNFIEHSNAAVIIIANEEEIGNWTSETNNTLEMMVALNEKLVVPVPAEEGNIISSLTSKQKVDDSNLTIDQLNKKRSIIFQKNERYLRVREKVIGQTITYEPDLMTVYSSLMFQNVKNTVLLNSMMQALDSIIMVAHRESHTNIRTFLFFLEKINTIFDAIDSKYPTIHNEIILYCYRSSIRHMKGEVMPIWENDYGQQAFRNGLSADDYCIGFQFIDTLIYTNTMNVEYVNSVLQAFSRLAEKKGQLSNDPYQLIRTWWRSDEKHVIGWLSEIIEGIKSGRYSTALYPDIIQYVSEFEANNLFKELCSDIIQTMRDYISSTKQENLEEFEREQFFLEGKRAEIFKKYYNELKEALDSAMQSSEKERYLLLIRNENQEKWGENLRENVRTMGFIRGRSFIFWITPDELLSRIKDSNSNQIYAFRLALQDIYSIYTNYQNKEEDYSNLSLLLQLLENEDTTEWDKIKNKQKEWLINDIHKYCDMIKQERSHR